MAMSYITVALWKYTFVVMWYSGNVLL